MGRDVESKAFIMQALSQPARIKILEMLRNSEECVCNIWPTLNESQSNISRHLAILRSAGLVEGRHKGINVYYKVSDKRIFDIIDIAGLITLKRAKDILK
jgi:ArsR family transcriptional regulator, arsenate/arsenite/antimonite-responsive transcriptional repressor